MTRILAGVCAGLLLIAGLLWWRLDATLQRAAVAEMAATQAADIADAWRLALEQQTAEVERTGQLLADTRNAHEALRTTTHRRIRAYERRLDTDPGAVDWDRLPVPAAVAERMCQYASDRPPGGDALPETAAGAAAADPDPACRPSTGQLWRWAERLVEAVERGNQDKAGLSAWVGSADAGRAAPSR